MLLRPNSYDPSDADRGGGHHRAVREQRSAVADLTFSLESLVTINVSEDLGSVLPFTTSFAALPSSQSPSGLSPWYVAVLVYAAWAPGLRLIGAVIIERRDP